VAARDPATYVIVSGAVLLVAIASAWLPARRIKPVSLSAHLAGSSSRPRSSEGTATLKLCKKVRTPLRAIGARSSAREFSAGIAIAMCGGVNPQ